MNLTKQGSGLPSTRDQRLKTDRRHFNVVFAAAFPLYLVAYGLASLLPANWRSSLFSVETNAGIIEQARMQSNLIASYVTMN